MGRLRSSFTALLMIASTAIFTGCGDDETEPKLKLVSLKAGDIDLNTATTAVNVPVGVTILAEFSTNVDETTVDAISLVREYDGAEYPVDVTVVGNALIIEPQQSFSTGTLFVLNFGAELTSDGGKKLGTPIERTFNSEGTFAVPGAFAQWTFEDNANDIIGGFDPSPSQIVGISYVAGRKADAGKAASFNGTTSIIEIANGDQLMNNGSWALSLWVKASEHTDNANKGHFVLGLGAFYGFQFEIFDNYNAYKLAGSYTNGTNQFGEDLWADGEGNLGWQGWTFSKDFRPNGMNSLIKNQWAHFVFVYDASTKLGTTYLNGEKIKEQDFDNWPDGDAKRTTTGLKYRGALPDVANELAFGFIQSRAGTLWDAEPWGGYEQTSAKHFKGLMDDVIIYHKSLSAAEVTLMYNSGKP